MNAVIWMIMMIVTSIKYLFVTRFKRISLNENFAGLPVGWTFSFEVKNTIKNSGIEMIA